MGLEELATFVEAVDQGSLAGAARALGVPKSTVSRRVARLEEELGQELLHRHARLFRVTEAGNLLYRNASAPLRDLQGAARTVRDGGEAIRGPLRITLPHDIGTAPGFVRTFTAFQRLWPEVEMTVEMTDRMVDLVAEGFDFAFRAHAGRLEDSSAIMARRLHVIDVGLYASPEYLDRRGRPQHPDDLAGHDCISRSLAPGIEAWPLHQRGQSVKVDVRPRLRASGMAFLPAAAILGAGVAAIPVVIAGDPVARGELERVLPEWCLPQASLSLLWPASRLPSPRRRAFLDFAVDRISAEFWGGPATP